MEMVVAFMVGGFAGMAVMGLMAAASRLDEDRRIDEFLHQQRKRDEGEAVDR